MMSRKASAFLNLAETELRAAKILCDHDLPAQAIYFVAQSAEKVSRAVVEAEGFRIGTTHSFDQIGSRLPVGHRLREKILDFDEDLSGASTRYRYPTDSGRVAEPRADRLGKLIDEVEDFIREGRRHLAGMGISERFKRP